MAAVTIGTPAPQRDVLGSLVQKTFRVSGVTGSTLSTGMVAITNVDIQQSTDAGTVSLITSFSVNPTTGVITFTSSGPMVTEVVTVQARKG